VAFIGGCLDKRPFAAYGHGAFPLSPREHWKSREAYIKGKVLTARNAFTKFNLPALGPETDALLFAFSPGSLGGLPPATVVATAGNDQISVAVTPPTLIPDGWSVTRCIAAAIKDQDPHSGTDYEITIGQDLSDPYTIVLTGLDPVLYVVGGWIEWLRSDGKAAYSISVNDTATPT